MKFTYYIQGGAAPSVRRYAHGQQRGERFDRGTRQWVPQCALRLACILTGDKIASVMEVVWATGLLVAEVEA